MVWRSVSGLGVAAGREILSGLGVAIVLALIVGVAVLWAHLVAAQRAYQRERSSREEMEAYVRLDTRTAQGSDLRELVQRVCDVVAARSPFHRVAMLLRGADGRLYLAAKSGLDVAAMGAMEHWTAQLEGKEQSGQAAINGGVRIGVRSQVVWLDHEHRGIAVPIWLTGGSMAGALVVFASSVLEVRRRAAEEAVVSLEALGVKLGQAMEDAEVTAKLLAVEKLMVAEIAWPELVASRRGAMRF